MYHLGKIHHIGKSEAVIISPTWAIHAVYASLSGWIGCEQMAGTLCTGSTTLSKASGQRMNVTDSPNKMLYIKIEDCQDLSCY